MINKVAIIGAGTMGYGIAFQFALKGTPTILCDKSERALDRARERFEKYLHIFQNEGYNMDLSSEEVINAVTFTTEIKDVADADFITECVVENLAVKQAIFKELDTICKADAILASNTSSLKLVDIIKEVKQHRTRCLLTHWFNPPHIVPLVELLVADETEAEVYDTVKQFLHSHSKVTIDVKKEVPGLVANRIQVAMAREVLSLLEDGVASPEDLDLAITNGPGFRLSLSGLLEIIDFGGIDVWSEVIKQLQPEIASHTNSYQTIHEKIASDHLGVKTGVGFYEYPNQSFDEYILNRDAKLLRQLIQRDTNH